MKKKAIVYLLISNEEFRQKMKTQIAIGKELESRQISSQQALENSNKEVSIWLKDNEELFKQSFNDPDNEYVEYYYRYDIGRFFIGRHDLSTEIEKNKHKVSHNLTGLEKVLGYIDSIPTKEKLLSLGFKV
jgi:alkyl sulfatase BDS1-like metallo-beta-lactamase superfamily hydrolase